MKKPGSTAMEVFIWATVFVFGPFYSFWRIASKKPVCAQCGGAILKDLDSKVGRIIAEKRGLVFAEDEEVEAQQSAHEEWEKIQEEVKKEELEKRAKQSNKQDPKEW